MKIRVNKKIVYGLSPCVTGFEAGTFAYPDFDGDILEFLNLNKIPAHDRIWVALGLIPREIVEIFAIDCAAGAAAAAAYANAVAVAAYAAAAYAYAAADAYADAAAAAAAAAGAGAGAGAAAAAAGAGAGAVDVDVAVAAERERQLDALAYLISTHKG